MSTTTTTALLASMLFIGCAPIGEPGRARTTDAGSGSGSGSDLTCDTVATETMDIDFTSTGSASIPTGCWKLDGKLTIGGSVTSLAKLGDLRGVTDLVINASQLTALDTPNPIAVTNSITIENNTKLTDLTNLSVPTDTSCSAYLASVSVTGNTMLTDLGAVSQIACISGATTIQNNAQLATIDLANATRLEGGLTIESNAMLTSIELPMLTSVTEGITIKGNALLTSLGAWSQLMFVHGSLTIDTNAALTTLEGVMPTTSIMIEGALTITNNAKLTEVGEFDHLTGAETIDVSNNASLDYCEAREIGCCVPDSDPQNVATAQIAANKTTTCTGASSWCYAPDGNKCHNDYTGYTGTL